MVTTENKGTSDIHNLEHEETPDAKRVLLVDELGNPINDSNPIKVDTELTLDGNLIIDNVSVFATDISDSTTTSFALVDLLGHLQVDIQDISKGVQTNDIKITLDGEEVTVNAVNLDIRDLTSVSDSVSAVQSGTWNIGTLTGITNDVNVNLQDGVGTNITSTLVGADQSLDVNLTQSVVLNVIEASASSILSEIQTLVAQGISTNMDGGGKVSVGTTAVEATFTGTTESIIISADTSNTGTLYVGKSNVTNTGANAITFLEAGESVTIDYNDSSNAVYVVASSSSQNFWKGALL